MPPVSMQPRPPMAPAPGPDRIAPNPYGYQPRNQYGFEGDRRRF
jgi:hypothetical protein